MLTYFDDTTSTNHQGDFSQNSPTLVSLKETCRILAVGSTTIYLWCRQGKLTAYKFGSRCTRFRLSEIEALINAHATKGGAQ